MDIQYYTKLLFNEETGKERYGLVSKEAEKIPRHKESLETINEWLNNKNANIRRAVTEGLRNWIKRPYFKDNPQEAIKLLSKHKTDESEYVRKSVGNALKDISKEYPESIKDELKKWKLETKEIMQVYKLANKIIDKKQ
jgi:3-methyladenine DNA glycosylase AlkC